MGSLGRRRLPKLLTARQYGASIGKSKQWVVGMCREGRIPDAQFLPVGWIIPEDAGIVSKHLDMELPPELVIEVRPHEPPKYMGRPINHGDPGHTKLELPGFARILAQFDGKVDVQNRTRVHRNTQSRILEGKKVTPDVARRLARGLNVTIEDLLRR